MKKFFSVIFNDGFDITDRLERVHKVLNTFGGIEIHFSDDPWQAYYCACFRHTIKKLSLNPFIMPILPKFEDVLNAPFYERITPVASPRFFALLAPGYKASIATDSNTVINFLWSFERAAVKEFNNYEEALGWVNKIFIVPIIAMGAYLREEIPMIDKLDDKVSQFPYEEWLEKNCNLPPEKRFTPENCVESPQESEYILPLELVELPPSN